MKTNKKMQKKAQQFLGWYITSVDNYVFCKRKKLMRNMVSIAMLIIFAVCLSFLHGCSSQDDTPLGSLASSKVSEKFNAKFWLNEYQNKTDLWNSASSYCRTAENKNNVNCGTIIQILMFANLNTEQPVYNSNNEGFGKIPNFKN